MLIGMGLLALLLALASAAWAIEVCPPVPVYEPCEIRFEMTDEEAARHANPYVSVTLRAEFRSPKGGRTKVIPGFWDGGKRFVVRFSPDYEGRWDFRLISNLESVNKKILSFDAAPPRTPGFIHIFNTRYFQYSKKNTPHFWMGDTSYRFATIPWETFRAIIDKRAEQKFTHLRGLVLGGDETAVKVLADPDRPLVEHFQEVDRRVDYMNQKGLVYDLILGGDSNELADLLDKRRRRERYVRYLVARYAAFNITWQGVQEFEEYEDGRGFLKEIMGYVKKMDPYQHPRSTHTTSTSSMLAADGWMDYIVEQSSAESLAAVDYELNPYPIVNTEFGYEDSGAGKSHSHHVDSDEFRHRLWRAAVRGQWVTFGNTGTYGGRNFTVDVKWADSPGARFMTVFRDFFEQSRYFDLQPYYRVEGGVALALQVIPFRSEKAQGVEYIVYVEKPGPVELIVPKSKYDVSWINPIDGTWIDEKKFKGERFRSPGPPDPSHDWVLYVRREGKKKGFNKSFWMESRRPKPKTVETARTALPYKIQFPVGPELVAGRKHEFNATLTKSTRAAKKTLFVWFAEVAGGRSTARVIGTAQFGRFRIPADLTDQYPATLQIRCLGVDGAGNIYEAFKPYTLVKE